LLLKVVAVVAVAVVAAGKRPTLPGSSQSTQKARFTGPYLFVVIEKVRRLWPFDQF
jgi:hypothetical protein